MASTSPPAEACAELLDLILRGQEPSDELLAQAMAEDDGRALFSVVVERLADLFEPRFCEAYARLFTRVLQRTDPDFRAEDLLDRYRRVREARAFSGHDVRRIVVLSRVTLGADVAVTSVVMDSLRRRFPEASLAFAGSEKNFGLFAGIGGLQHIAAGYPRHGGLKDRLRHRPVLPADAGTLVVDPDSRLTQLGLVPVCPERQYVFFEGRSYGAESSLSLRELTSQWTEEVFGIPGQALVAPEGGVPMPCAVAVSLGTGGNPSKRIDGSFEEDLLRWLTRRGHTVMLDGGAGGDETERAHDLVSRIAGVQIYEGPFAPFASMITQAKLYVGYDSGGAHVAAAAGTPLVSIFGGQPSRRFFQRWRPGGAGPVKVVEADADALPRACRAIEDLL